MIELNEIKRKLAQVLDTYRSSGRLTEKFCSDFEKLFDLESLRIGIIGKMKAGKSSLVNALVFGNNVLPTGNKPVTVTLTEISYGKEDCVQVELLTEEDIAELKSEAGGKQEEKAKAAAEILALIDKVEGGYQQYLQPDKRNIRIRLEDLNEYVAEGGRLSGLAKSVRIVLNNPQLQGVTIIDTPGFNDPVRSRGKTTKNALKDCQILLFVHDVLDMYDQEEISLLTNQIEYAGISEMVDVVNKIDLADGYGIGQWPDYLRAFEGKKKAALERIASPVVQELLRTSRSIYVSPYMALLGFIPDEDFHQEMKKDYVYFQEEFPELCEKQDFITYSHIEAVADEINRLARDGSKYLMETPLITLLGQLQSVATVIEGEIRSKESELSILKMKREAAAAKVKEFNGYVFGIEDAIKHSKLPVDLSTLILDTEKEILNIRRNEGNGQFTEANYPETEFLSSGIQKANLTRYNLFISETDDKIRNKLNGLKGSFRTRCESYVDGIVVSLVSQNIKEEDRKMFKDALLSSLNLIVAGIEVAVSTSRVKSQLTGGQKQYGLYKNKFDEQYDDNRIRELLKPFRNSVEELTLDFKLLARERLASIAKTVKQSAEFDPVKKGEAIREAEGALKTLNDELDLLQKDIVKLRSIQNKK